jgi:hypothetical protein
MGLNDLVVSFKVPADVFPLFQYSTISCEEAGMNYRGRKLIPKVIAIKR